MKDGRNLVQMIAEGGRQEREPHWTDNATERPIFSSVIDARGPRGNIISISAAAQAMLMELRIPYDRVQELSSAITMSESYEDAIKLVEKWFKVDRGEEE